MVSSSTPPLKLLLAALTMILTALIPADAAFRVPATCRADEFFDTAGVTCEPCVANASPSLEDLQGGYKTQCSCDGGRRTVFSDPAIDEPLDFGTCSACPEGSVPSNTGYYCVQCDGSQGSDWTAARVNAEGTACECATPTRSSVITNLGIGGALLTGDANSTFLQRCVTCPSGTQPDAAAMRCSSCEYPKFWNGERCVCPTNLPEGSRCALTEEAWQNIMERGSPNFDVAFEDVKTASSGEVGREVVVENSALLVERLEASASACFQTADRRACNELGNFCVLQMHDTDASACVLYQELVDLRQDEQYHEDELTNAGWSLSMPWLYYPSDAIRYLRATDVLTRVKFSGDNTGGSTPTASVLQFKAARYALDGTFLGWRNFTHDLQLCGGQRKYTNAWARFAVEYLNSCELPLSTILDAAADQPEFIDLYFEDGPGLLYPVPSILENIPDNNRIEDELAFLQLTRRFFTVDAISGIEDGASEPAVVRYMEKFSLEVMLQASNSRGGNDGLIYPPSVRIRYAARDPSVAGVTNTAAFSVHYTQAEDRLEDFIDAWDYMIIAAMITAIVIGLVKAYRFTKNQGSGSGQNGSELMALFEFIAILADVGSAAIFFVLAAVSIYWVCFFKLQSSVYTTLPLDEGQVWYRFRVSVICTMVGRATAVLWMMWRQSSVDIFFIDWTEAKEVMNDKTSSQEKAPVSCWRSLFVANEWNELQTLRVTSLEVTMLGVIFLLAGVDLENGAKINPDEGSLDVNPFEQTSQILRFGISVSIFILIEAAQMLFMKMVVYWKIANPLVDFVDLLWLSNISMFVLDRRSGYYLHGQFTGTFVDTDAESLHQELLKPSNSTRGFVENHDCQTFIVFIDGEVRERYDKFLNRVSTRSNNERNNKTFIEAFVKGPQLTGTDKGLQQESQALCDIFKADLESARQDHNAPIIDPGLLSKWTMLGPDGNNKTTLWYDRSMSFTNFLFYGNELSLFMLEVMLFTSVDMRLRSAAFSGPITYLIMWVLNYFRHRWGKHNLSEKSLIDSKFLI